MTESPQELLAHHTPEVQEVVGKLRALMRGMLPDTELTDRRPLIFAYGRSRRMRDLLFAVIPHSAHVNLQFADGARLPDPEHLLEGTGKRIRHVKMRTLTDVDRHAVRALVEAQLAVRPAAT